MTARLFAAGLIAVVSLGGCVDKKPAADTTAAATRLPAPDTIKAAPVAAADTVKLKKQAATPTPTKTNAATQTSTKQKLGRDSVDTKPKLLGLPVVSDTAKPRKPL